MQNIDLPEPKPEEIYPPCEKCKGTGMALGFGNVILDCPYCDGHGYIEPEEDDEIPY